MSLEKKQAELDSVKWADSEKQGRDTCGDYAYCAKCDKTADFPCAKAYEAHSAAAVKKAAAKPAAKKTAAKK